MERNIVRPVSLSQLIPRINIMKVKFYVLNFILAFTINYAQSQETNHIPALEDKEKLVRNLQTNLKYINSIRDSLELLAISTYDKITTERFLVTEGRAKLIKTNTIDLVNNFPSWNSQLEPLLKIINGCEGHGMDWDVYCFSDMPFQSAEPILRVFMIQYELTINNVNNSN
jgi:hypothetical protein